MSLGDFDTLWHELTPSRDTVSKLPALSRAYDDVDSSLGDFSAIWRFLDSGSMLEPAPAVVTPTRAKKSSGKRPRSSKQIAPPADTTPELLAVSSASEDEIATSDEDSAAMAAARMAELRSALDRATERYNKSSPAQPAHQKLEPRQRITNTYEKLAKRFPGCDLAAAGQRERAVAPWTLLYSPRSLASGPASSISSKDDIHVFVDSSNLYLGFQQTLQELYPRTYPQHAPPHKRPVLDLAVLCTILERGRPAPVRSLVGSSPLLQSWDTARHLGYEISMLERVAATNIATPTLSTAAAAAAGTPARRVGRREQGVDELLHMKILESLVDAPQPATIVLGTGDARQAQFSGGFFDCALRALARGWCVEVVSWRKGLGAPWRDGNLKKSYGEKFRLVLLDDYLDELEA